MLLQLEIKRNKFNRKRKENLEKILGTIKKGENEYKYRSNKDLYKYKESEKISVSIKKRKPISSGVLRE